MLFVSTIGGAIIFFSIGYSILYFKAWPDYQTAKKSMKWPRVTGTVLSSKITKRWSSRSGKHGIVTIYTPEISYSYVANGKQFQSSQIHVGGKWGISSSRYAHQYVDKYPVGKGIIVRHSPKDESNAVLEPGVHGLHYIFLGFGTLFVIIGVLFFLSLFT